MVQHLVTGGTSTLLTVQTATLIHTQTLVNTTPILFQVEYKTVTQSWLVLGTSHLMRWRCFILAESQDVKTKTNFQQFYIHSKLRILLSIVKKKNAFI